MLFTVKVVFHKNTNKHIEGIEEIKVFAADKKVVEALIKGLFDSVNSQLGDKYSHYVTYEYPQIFVWADWPVEQIYKLYPELKGTSPDKGCIIDQQKHFGAIYKYAKP